jgi:hypothetical protein
MVSTYTAHLALELLANGDGLGTWGASQNANFDLLDLALDATNDFTVTTDAALTVAETVAAVDRLEGSPVAARVLTLFADRWKSKFVDNVTAQGITYRGSAAATQTVVVQPMRHAALKALNNELVELFFTKRRHGAVWRKVKDTVGNGATTINVDEAGYHRLTLAGNTTLTIARWPLTGACARFFLRVVQDATGGRTLAWPAAVDWPDAVAQAPATGIGDITDYMLMSVDGGTTIQTTLAGKDMS